VQPAGLTEFKEVLRTPGLPELGPERRPGTKTVSDLDLALDEFFRERKLGGVTADALRAAAFFWHDHLDESHRISQSLHSANGSFLHGIMHRREPDYSNAKYWFRHVGDHPAFPEIARQVGARLSAAPQLNAVVRDVILKGGAWNPFGFVDLCEQCCRGGALSSQRPLIQELQAIEFNALLEHL
jgi:hypothetical protein